MEKPWSPWISSWLSDFSFSDLRVGVPVAPRSSFYSSKKNTNRKYETVSAGVDVQRLFILIEANENNS